MSENTFKYCYILDYSNETICCIELDLEFNCSSDEELLRAWGFNPDTCSWMLTDEEIESIIKVNKPLK